MSCRFADHANGILSAFKVQADLKRSLYCPVHTVGTALAIILDSSINPGMVLL